MCFSRVCSAPAFLRYSLVLVVAAKCTIHTSPPTRTAATATQHTHTPTPHTHTPVRGSTLRSVDGRAVWPLVNFLARVLAAGHREAWVRPALLGLGQLFDIHEPLLGRAAVCKNILSSSPDCLHECTAVVAVVCACSHVRFQVACGPPARRCGCRPFPSHIRASGLAVG